jgi:hypothetical protein
MLSPRIAALVRRHALQAKRCAVLAMFLSLGGLACVAQEDPTYTLHIYANLVQIPVLIRSPHFDSVPKVDPMKLNISIDGGIPFRPSHVRPEGADPLALAILLDVGDGSNTLLPDFSKALVKAAGRALHPQDNVAIYVLNCTLNIARPFGPPDATQLKLTSNQAVDSTRQLKSCAKPLHLRDSLALLTGEFATQRGRRVILAITDGHDTGSKLNALQMNQYATDAGVAIFGFAPSHQTQQDMNTLSMPMSRNRVPQPVNRTVESEIPIDNDFDSFCKNSGGLARLIPPDTLTNALVNFVDMVRDRFIIEFPRPKEATTAGIHNIAVTLTKSNAYIHTAGIGLPIPDSHILADNTVESQSTPPAASTANEPR